MLYRGREDEWVKIEQAIVGAAKEGRIIGAQDFREDRAPARIAKCFHPSFQGFIGVWAIRMRGCHVVSKARDERTEGLRRYGPKLCENSI